MDSKVKELIEEIDQEWALDRRKEFLSDRMADNVVAWWVERAKHSDYVSRGRLIEDMMTLESMQTILGRILKDMNEIYYRRQMMKGQQVGITQEQIERARAFPFEELHVFVHRRSACPIHGGRNPQSFELLKDNTARCHSCGWRGDTIAFWQEKNGRGFADAVRSLQ